MPLDKEFVVASVFPVCFQWSSNDLQVVYQCVPLMQINIGLGLGASISQSGSSGIPVYLWILSGWPLEDHCGVSVVCPVVSQCTDRFWFGGHWVRSLPSMQALMYTSGMARVVWAKLISFELQPQIQKKTIMVLLSKACTEWCWSNYTFDEQNWYPLQSSKLQVNAEL